MLIATTLLVLNNPKQYEYNQMLDNFIQKRYPNIGIQFLSALFPNQLSSYIQNHTTKENFIFFSIYNTNTPVGSVTFIGIFSNFIPISYSPDKKSHNTIPSLKTQLNSNYSNSSTNLGTNTNLPTASKNKANIPFQAHSLSPNLVQVGMAQIGDNSSHHFIPLMALKATYGIQPSPPTRPMYPLPKFNFFLSKSQVNQLALYWLTSYTFKGTQEGIVFLGPRGWIVTTAAIGANGGEEVTLQSPSNSQAHLSIRMDAGLSSMISDTATYFPTTKEWARTLGYYSTDKLPYQINIVPLGPESEDISYQNPTNIFRTNGVVFSTFATRPLNPNALSGEFAIAKVSLPSSFHNIESRITSFFVSNTIHYLQLK